MKKILSVCLALALLIGVTELNAAADDEGIINFATDNIEVGAKTYTTAEFCCRIAGILAGLPLNRSATYYTLPEIESITESETPDDDVDNGKLILINDGTKTKMQGVSTLLQPPQRIKAKISKKSKSLRLSI